MVVVVNKNCSSRSTRTAVAVMAMVVHLCRLDLILLSERDTTQVLLNKISSIGLVCPLSLWRQLYNVPIPP